MGFLALVGRGFRALTWTACVCAPASSVFASFGDRDCTFGSGGTQTFSGSYYGEALAFAVEPSGHVLVLVGFKSTGANLVRTDASGTTSETVTWVSTGGMVDPAIALLGDGRILLLANYPAAVSRHLPTGALDTSFGDSGKAALPGVARAFAGPILQPDGKILVGGAFNGGAAVVRFLADGTLDSSFGAGGVVAAPASGAGYVSLALQPDGRILAASPSALVRYEADGRVDTAFGAGGMVSLVEALPGSAASWGDYLEVQPSGKILILGANASFGLRIVRFGPSGALDTTVGGGTGYRDVVVPGGPLRYGSSPALQPDGKPIIVGDVDGRGLSGAIVRYGVDLTDDVVAPLDFASTAPFVLPSGRLLLGVRQNLAFNSPAIQRRLGDLDVATCVATSTAVSTSPNPSRFGEWVTFTAVVSPASGSETPTGLVQFSSDGTSLGSPVALSGGTASLTTSSLTEGPHTITAVYAGGSGFLGSTSPPLTHAVTSRPPSVTTMSSSPNPSVFGQAVTLTATVAPASGAGTATGTVQFRSGSSSLAAPVPFFSGTATLTTSTLAAGSHVLTAAYSGDPALAPSSSPPLTHVVLTGLAVQDVSVAEGSAQNAAFRVTLGPPVFDRTVTVEYSTADGTAIAGQDYVASAGTLTFTPGRTVHSIAVPILSDTTAEGAESFSISLTSATGAAIARAQAVGTIADPPTPAVVPMYRAYNPYADYHFFTVSLAEFDNAVANGYRDESHPPCCTIPFHVPNTQVDGASAIFRMYNPNNGRHYYTASAFERDSLRGVGWVYEKDEGFLYPTLEAGTTEVFRLYNKNSGVHLYTADVWEKDAILATFPGIWFQHASLGYAFELP